MGRVFSLRKELGVAAFKVPNMCFGPITQAARYIMSLTNFSFLLRIFQKCIKTQHLNISSCVPHIHGTNKSNEIVN